MYRVIKPSEDIFGMANVTKRKSGLPVSIWSDHSGIQRKVSHNNTPRIKIDSDDYSISVTIEPSPIIKAQSSSNIPKTIMKDLKKGIDYVGRNYDIFLKHYMDTDDSFDDEDLFNALRERGEYK